MAELIQLKRRNTGSADAPTTLKTGEPAYNAVSDTLYIGRGDDGGGNATSVAPIGGAGAFATKPFVESAVSIGAAGLDVKASVRLATTADIALSGAQTIDGVALAAGNRVLVKAQADGAQNGIYTVSSGAWTRSSDANSAGTLNAGAFVYVEAGAHAGQGWVLITQPPLTIGTTALTFAQFSTSSVVVDGGLTERGGPADGILLRRSHRPGAVPAHSEFDSNTIVLNHADGLLYWRDSGGAVRSLDLLAGASASRFFLSTSADPTTSDVPDGQWRLVLNLTTNGFGLWANRGGTLVNLLDPALF